MNEIVGPSNPLLVVANKVDMLPATANQHEVTRWVTDACARQGVTRISQMHLVSCKSGAGMDSMLDRLQRTMREKNMDAYVVGAANAGKSTFLNRCLKHFSAGGKLKLGGGKKPPRAGKVDAPEEGTLTTSHLPGTTLDFVRVSLPSARQALYDTPGLIVPSQLTTLLTTAELAARRGGESAHLGRAGHGLLGGRASC